jgi:hypothetical protein
VSRARSRRGSTGAGRPAPVPNGHYARSSEALRQESFVVAFVGEDERRRAFDVGTLPLPGWHAPLAQSWAQRTGPAGTLRTLSSAAGSWAVLSRFMQHLGSAIDPPLTPDKLRERHFIAFKQSLEDTSSRQTVAKHLHIVGIILEQPPLAAHIDETLRALFRPRTRNSRVDAPGYSDSELRSILAAARSDVRSIRDRLHKTTNKADAPAIEETLRTGSVPADELPFLDRMAYRRRLAEQVFVTRRDLIPLLTLFVQATGWNVETIKELTTSHRIIEGVAVEVSLLKRRRGPGRWHNSATWEIGKPGQELRTPGGLYLMVLHLMAPARSLLDDDPYWAVWLGAGRSSQDRVGNPFKRALDTEVSNREWSARHQLRSSQPSASGVDGIDDDHASKELSLSFPRLKKSVDVRRTRAVGGHLPSATRSNTVPVLFRNYLSGDPSTLDWAQQVMSDAVADVEKSAWDAHQKALEASGRTHLDVQPRREIGDPSSARTPAEGETGWASCRDHAHHPLTGRRCSHSFLDCFHCANSVVTNEHLPGLLSLLDALEQRRSHMSIDGWWLRYGPTWTAIRYDVLPQFTDGEVRTAEEQKQDDHLLELVEPRWEHY